MGRSFVIGQDMDLTTISLDEYSFMNFDMLMEAEKLVTAQLEAVLATIDIETREKLHALLTRLSAIELAANEEART